jgi:double-stranded uracil-DNA glycosylase
MVLLKSFPCIADPQATRLIVGSMPGRRSLETGEYYAHPQNCFWEIMGTLFGAKRSLDYAERLACLQDQRIALWDVAHTCERVGSLDSAIETATIVPNDFAALFDRAPGIREIFFNGHKAQQLFRRFVAKNLGERDLQCARLPSTSPAHAAMTRSEKIRAWRRALCPSQHIVYILQSLDGRLYTGYTTDLDRRLQEHRAGKGQGAKFTRAFGVSHCLYSEELPTKSAALKREAAIKSWSRAQKETLVRRNQ